MNTAILSSIILQDRHQGLTEEDLLKKTLWLYNEIQERNGLLSLTIKPNVQQIRKSIGLMSDLLENNKKSNVFELQIRAKKDYKNILMLSYYRNNLVHVFLNETFIAASLISFGKNLNQEVGVSLQRVWEQTSFISQLLKNEFIVREKLETFQQFL